MYIDIPRSPRSFRALHRYLKTTVFCGYRREPRSRAWMGWTCTFYGGGFGNGGYSADKPETWWCSMQDVWLIVAPDQKTAPLIFHEARFWGNKLGKTLILSILVLETSQAFLKSVTWYFLKIKSIFVRLVSLSRNFGKSDVEDRIDWTLFTQFLEEWEFRAITQEEGLSEVPSYLKKEKMVKKIGRGDD